MQIFNHNFKKDYSPENKTEIPRFPNKNNSNLSNIFKRSNSKDISKSSVSIGNKFDKSNYLSKNDNIQSSKCIQNNQFLFVGKNIH